MLKSDFEKLKQKKTLSANSTKNLVKSILNSNEMIDCLDTHFSILSETMQTLYVPLDITQRHLHVFFNTLIRYGKGSKTTNQQFKRSLSILLNSLVIADSSIKKALELISKSSKQKNFTLKDSLFAEVLQLSNSSFWDISLKLSVCDHTLKLLGHRQT